MMNSNSKPEPPPPSKSDLLSCPPDDLASWLCTQRFQVRHASLIMHISPAFVASDIVIGTIGAFLLFVQSEMLYPSWFNDESKGGARSKGNPFAVVTTRPWKFDECPLDVDIDENAKYHEDNEICHVSLVFNDVHWPSIALIQTLINKTEPNISECIGVFYSVYACQ